MAGRNARKHLSTQQSRKHIRMSTAPAATDVSSAAAGDPQESLAIRAYRELEDLIVRMEFPPGLAISENELSSRLNIGRTPIREALHRLAREGLVHVSPRRGVFVTEIRVDAQRRLLEVRRGLERLMSARAARLASPEERAEFGRIAEEMRKAGETGGESSFLQLDQRFNMLLATACNNEFAAAAAGLASGQSRRFWFKYYRTMADFPLTCTLHADVAAAIAAQEPEEAAAASDRLLDYIEQFTRSVFESLS